MASMAEEYAKVLKFWRDKVCRVCGAPAQNYVADFDQLVEWERADVQLVLTGESFYCPEHTRPSYIRRV